MSVFAYFAESDIWHFHTELCHTMSIGRLIACIQPMAATCRWGLAHRVSLARNHDELAYHDATRLGYTGVSRNSDLRYISRVSTHLCGRDERGVVSVELFADALGETGALELR